MTLSIISAFRNECDDRIWIIKLSKLAIAIAIAIAGG